MQTLQTQGVEDNMIRRCCLKQQSAKAGRERVNAAAEQLPLLCCASGPQLVTNSTEPQH
jgi:hypothetical protein